MPTPEFTQDNAAPLLVALALQSHDHNAPAAVAISTPAHSNSAPSTVAMASMAGTAGAPVAVPRASQVPDNASPSGIPVAAPPFNATPPSAIARPDQTPSNASPMTVVRADQTPSDGAPASVVRADQTPSDNAPRALPVATTTGTDSTPQPIGYTPPLGPLSDETMHTPSLHFTGNLSLNQIFGYYVAPAACVIKGVQLFAQKAPAGADVVITLVDADGTSLSRTATLPAGASTINVNFGTPLPLLNGATVRAKVTQIGAGVNPGAYVTATLIVQLGS